MKKLLVRSMGLLALTTIISSAYAMDNFEKEMQEIQEKAEASRKENVEKYKQMIASLSQAKSAEEKAAVIATRIGVQPHNLLDGADKLLEKK